MPRSAKKSVVVATRPTVKASDNKGKTVRSEDRRQWIACQDSRGAWRWNLVSKRSSSAKKTCDSPNEKRQAEKAPARTTPKKRARTISIAAKEKAPSQSKKRPASPRKRTAAATTAAEAIAPVAATNYTEKNAFLAKITPRSQKVPFVLDQNGLPDLELIGTTVTKKYLFPGGRQTVDPSASPYEFVYQPVWDYAGLLADKLRGDKDFEEMVANGIRDNASSDQVWPIDTFRRYVAWENTYYFEKEAKQVAKKFLKK